MSNNGPDTNVSRILAVLGERPLTSRAVAERLGLTVRKTSPLLTYLASSGRAVRLPEKVLFDGQHFSAYVSPDSVIGRRVLSGLHCDADLFGPVFNEWLSTS